MCRLCNVFSFCDIFNCFPYFQFANAVRNESYADDLEELLHRLRLSPNATDTLPSTSHAVIRYFVTLRKYDELIRILNDRLNYGIFPDDYCCGLLMDTFIKENNYTGTLEYTHICTDCDHFCGLVVRVLGYRSGGPGSIPGTTSKKK
jgi:hypothetical protein